MVWENFFEKKKKYLHPNEKSKDYKFYVNTKYYLLTPVKKKLLLLQLLFIHWSQNNSNCITNATVCLHFYIHKSKQTTALAPKLLYWLHYILLLWNFYSETEPIDFLYTTLALSSPFIENITYRITITSTNIYRGLLEKKNQTRN